MTDDPSPMAEPSVTAVLGPLGAAIMRVLWEEGDTAVGTIVDRLQSEGTGPAYSTVTTILGRLHQRGLVERRPRGREALYRPAVSETELVVMSSSRAVDAVIARYGSTAMRHFAERLADLDPDLRRQLLEAADRHRARSEPEEGA